MDFAHDRRTQQLIATAESFLAERIIPSQQAFHDQLAAQEDRWEWSTVPVLKQLQQEARDLGLWNVFLPREHADSPGLSNLEYAPIAEITGRAMHLAPPALNCSAPTPATWRCSRCSGRPSRRSAG